MHIRTHPCIDTLFYPVILYHRTLENRAVVTIGCRKNKMSQYWDIGLMNS